MPSTRLASKAGSWYSKTPTKLSRELGKWLDDVPDEVHPISQHVDPFESASKLKENATTYTPPVSGARVIIAPHAGYAYSGPAAAWAYKSLDLSNCKRIFLLGPSHVWYLKDCAISSHTKYATPLGDLTLDQSTIAELNQTGKFRAWPQRQEGEEHSLELHLPYIYEMCSRAFASPEDFPLLVPVLVGNVDPPRGNSSNSPKDEVSYGQLFAPYLSDPSTVFVISSDFCHWGERFSFQSELPRIVDKSAMKAIETGSHQAFAEDLAETRNTVCGRHPIGIIMAALEVWRKEHGKKADDGLFKFLRYERSGEIESEDDSSVSYCSAIAILS